MDQLSPTLSEPPPGSPSVPTVTVTTLGSLSKLIEKRTASWLYLQRAYSSSPDRWFQTVQISQLRIERCLVETLGSTKFAQETRNLFVLGMSLGPVLDAESATEFCRSMIRILEGWEVWNEGGMNGKGNGGVVSLAGGSSTSRRLIHLSRIRKTCFETRGPRGNLLPGQRSNMTILAPTTPQITTRHPTAQTDSAHRDPIQLLSR